MTNGNTQVSVTDELRRRVELARPGERLPSVRELMARHRASPATVGRAIAALAAEGLVEPRPGQGTFVAAAATDRGPAAPDVSWQAVALGARSVDESPLQELMAVRGPGALLLSGGYLEPELQPLAALGAALARAARRPGAWDRGAVE
ncbi:MAG TPA: winged helix-turn-helix domain-containing protein, partial [Solirubrobacteraceae bacterium]|nr:winged helix-turn-helix domain-containing protein [Solirubrobacteraceae bacterium]